MAKASNSLKKLVGTPAEQVSVTNPNAVTAVYSNHFGISATMTDFTIYFLELGQIPGPHGTIQKNDVKAIVTLPMMAAIGLIEVLQQLVQRQTEQTQNAASMRKSVQ